MKKQYKTTKTQAMNDTDLTPFTKNWFTMITEPNDKKKIKLLAVNMSSTVNDFGFGDFFLDTTLKE